ncbi:imidazole glycerol phosphate synthase subunit HisH [Aureispira sp. CCB-E]|uniref:imidazole glycerol phosphate synthase subunit HisH n=1 Tax=Aureispira sp. CCB-E TaxID=3051121 RepID=UPI0028696BEC|nr:imidazole glycerol phosphate synthase subunit HisH [Aureispira sp. CCB-E]WMX12903.1 imidazole glycerol phosphate synthase subunit HisH [Aureispira sp. CCB-E]
MKVAIIDYNAGNTRSVQFALERLGVVPILTKEAAVLSEADKVIFPGVGAANSTMAYLEQTGLDVVIKNLKKPVLGICLGMQLLCDFSEEGNVKGLGIFPQQVKRFMPQKGMKVPHMGWNQLSCEPTALLEGVASGSYVYFVHGYYVEVSVHTIARCNYGGAFSAALHKDNFYATQFHPEKSGSVGAKILKNFIDL